MDMQGYVGHKQVYEASSELCEERTKQLQSEVKAGKQNTENLKATIAKETADKEGESTKIEELTGFYDFI